MMEILNNIWSALTTENLELINITSIPILFFIEIPLLMYMFIYALGISANRNQKLLYIISTSIVGIFTNFVIPSPFNVIFNYGMMFILILSIFKLRLLCILGFTPNIRECVSCKEKEDLVMEFFYA